MAWIAPPVFAMFWFSLIGQIIVCLVIVGLYHAWASSKRPGGPSFPNVKAQPSAPTPLPAKEASPAAGDQAAPTAALIPRPIAVVAQTPLQPQVDQAELAAVIAAAVAVALNRPHRMLAVQQAAAPISHLNVWAFEGRVEIFNSHRLR